MREIFGPEIAQYNLWRQETSDGAGGKEMVYRARVKLRSGLEIAVGAYTEADAVRLLMAEVGKVVKPKQTDPIRIDRSP